MDFVKEQINKLAKKYGSAYNIGGLNFYEDETCDNNYSLNIDTPEGYVNLIKPLYWDEVDSYTAELELYLDMLREREERLDELIHNISDVVDVDMSQEEYIENGIITFSTRGTKGVLEDKQFTQKSNSSITLRIGSEENVLLEGKRLEYIKDSDARGVHDKIIELLENY